MQIRRHLWAVAITIGLYAFAVRAETNFAIIKSFGVPENSGVRPEAGLIEGTDGLLYGTTFLGGASPSNSNYTSAGTVFRIRKDGTAFTTLHHFSSIDGAQPGGLIEASDGKLYGATRAGGMYGSGALFRLRKDGGDFENIFHFDSGTSRAVTPVNVLVESSTGALVGATLYGAFPQGATIFRVNKDGTAFSIVYEFVSNWELAPSIIKGPDGQLYASAITDSFGNGSVYRINTDDWGFTPIYNFPTNNLQFPKLSFASSDGKLYGISGNDAVFSLRTNGTELSFLKVFSEGSDGRNPVGVAEGIDGYLYGCTQYGKTFVPGYPTLLNRGLVFRLARDGTDFFALHEFVDDWIGHTVLSGIIPLSGVVPARDGALYGTTVAGAGSSLSGNNGVIYRVTTNGSAFDVIHRFDETGGDGKGPLQVIAGQDCLYGVTSGGGNASVFGSIFALRNDGTAYKQIFRFSDPFTNGSGPRFLIKPLGGHLYGVCGNGLGDNYRAALFKVATNGTGFQFLHILDRLADGYGANALLFGRDNRLYGCTSVGGPLGWGTIYSVNTNGTGFAVLRAIGAPEGRPQSLVEGPDDYLYGGTPTNVFRLSKDGTVYQSRPTPVFAALIQSRDGFLYGISVGMTIIRLNPADLSSEVVYRLGELGSAASLVEGTDGVLYGSIQNGGPFNSGWGIIFRLNRDGSRFAVIHRLNPVNRGARTAGPLIEGPDAALYVPTLFGGSMDFGTICRIVPPPEILEVSRSFGSTRVAIGALSGRRVRVERSTDLLNWTVLGTAVSVNGRTQLEHSNASPTQFYRAVAE
jgi:uncharacterized repeat protein (TIGR03803 family)